MQGECNSKAVKRSFTGLDTAEPQLILCKSTQYLMQKYTISYAKVHNKFVIAVIFNYF